MDEKPAPSRLDQLAHELELAKEAEEQARNHRRTIEQQLCDVVGVKSEGSHTSKGDYYKVTTTAGFTRSLDQQKWADVRKRIPQSISASLVRTRQEINQKQLKSLQLFDPVHYQMVAAAITTKAKKVAVSCQRLEAT